MPKSFAKMREHQNFSRKFLSAGRGCIGGGDALAAHRACPADSVEAYQITVPESRKISHWSPKRTLARLLILEKAARH